MICQIAPNWWEHIFDYQHDKCQDYYFPCLEDHWLCISIFQFSWTRYISTEEQIYDIWYPDKRKD